MSKEKILSTKREGDNKKDEIPTPTDKCLLLDLDMTLIDKSYNISDPLIFETIKKLQNKGWDVGLNSNTPLEPLLVWMRYFGMNGPVIAEKGAVVYAGGSVLFNEKQAALIQSSVKAMTGSLIAASIQWLPGNPVDIIREHRFGDLQPGPLVLVDTSRKCSVSFYVREVIPNGEAIVNPDLTRTMIEKLRGHALLAGNLEEELHLEEGRYLALPRGQTKRLGILTLMKYGGLTQVGVVGDSMNDFLGDDIAIHYAVGNAKEDYKHKAMFISEFPMTKGCVDIIERIASK